MHKEKTYYVSLAVFLVVSAVVFWGFKRMPQIEEPQSGSPRQGIVSSDIVYYCSSFDKNCLNMERYFSDNKVSEKIYFSKIDVVKSPESVKEMDLQATGCGLDKKDYGTPFLFAEGKCYVAENEIKQYFEKKLVK